MEDEFGTVIKNIDMDVTDDKSLKYMSYLVGTLKD